jgi:hypothetical protein
MSRRIDFGNTLYHLKWWNNFIIGTTSTSGTVRPRTRGHGERGSQANDDRAENHSGWLVRKWIMSGSLCGAKEGWTSTTEENPLDKLRLSTFD